MINFGIVGCGHISQKHALALQKIKNAELVAVCDADLSRTISFVRQYGVAAYKDYEEFIKDKRIDAVIICTPSGLHASMGKKAALAGKHILMEKPFVLNIQDGRMLINICRNKGVKLGVVHPNRMKPVVQALHKAVNGGHFGKISHVNATLRWNRGTQYYSSELWRGTRELDGGILFNQAIHNLDLLNWLVGPVNEVFAYGATRLRDIEFEDVCVSVLKLSSGALGVIEASITIYPENLEETLSIFGSQGTAVLGGKSLSSILQWKFSCLQEYQALAEIERLNNIQNFVGHVEVIDDFVNAILLDHDPLVTGGEALKTLQLISAIYNSMESHRIERV